ncbi:hypothetical protein GJAV_G00044100 [Gymnothorax javanicus]|nr:hypothetical protein GJAV_G00044100 [Gymnothorax javanicus]
MRPLKLWLDSNSVSSWKIIEENIITPIRLKDFLFCGLSSKHCALRYGPILSYMLNIFKKIEKFVGFTSKWHKSSPLWHNKYLLSEKKPFIQNLWAEKGIWAFGDINGNDSLPSFNELMALYNIPKHSLFFYFRLRSALRTHNVTWGSGLKEHPVVKWFHEAPKSTVSFLYKKLLSHLSPKPSTGEWDRSMGLRGQTVNWEASWHNICTSSHNPNHQFIHMKIAHRAYLTPRVRHLMGLAPHPLCTICSQNALGSFMHVMWDCSKIYDFWIRVIECLSDLIGIQLPIEPALHLLNDESLICMNGRSRKIWLAGLTAAKMIIVQVWVPPHNLSFEHWLNTFLDILFLELFSAKVNGATPRTLQIWNNGISKVKDIIMKKI